MRCVGTWPRTCEPPTPGVGIPKVHRPWRPRRRQSATAAPLSAKRYRGPYPPSRMAEAISSGAAQHAGRPTYRRQLHPGLQTVGRQPLADTGAEGALTPNTAIPRAPNAARDCRTTARYTSLRCHRITLAGIPMPTAPVRNDVATAHGHQIHGLRNGPRKSSAMRCLECVLRVLRQGTTLRRRSTPTTRCNAVGRRARHARDPGPRSPGR
jgi:hypothetical protein